MGKYLIIIILVQERERVECKESINTRWKFEHHKQKVRLNKKLYASMRA
jgi:hypothetical protein